MKKIKKKLARPVTLEQWIEVEVKDGKTVTSFYPPNAELERIRLEMDPPPVLVYRRYNFVHGVPPDYLWTQPSPSTRLYGGGFLQRMIVSEWLVLLESERLAGNTVAHSSRYALVRPEALGPCSCPECTAEREAKDAA